MDVDEVQLLADFRAKFRVDELLIASTPAWSWSLRPAQATVGAGVLSLNRYAAAFAEVSAAEMAELAVLVAQLEGALKSVFDYDVINYLMLMMVDKHVHFHVIPRYQGVRQFAGLEWVDSAWPAVPALSVSQHSGEEGVLSTIREAVGMACAS
ncbi:MAG: HIT family protein [Candidatus Accumulibacter meliphilus]|jgi:diadenosine tetraphosphate (Ap4A) HIT family hydrolase|uniref:HIT family protein n=1 Tax=Candidatus Accumulibacter meliphilus TaxID=2211374 RepID=A0A369XNS4_9PROT|nr:MAG: HIT family protein [Candidatus Accumulibacter meliphilus]